MGLADKSLIIPLHGREIRIYPRGLRSTIQ